MSKEPLEMTICGYKCSYNPHLGHLAVYHDGDITWDDLQKIKNDIWGGESRAIEVYPSEIDKINSINCRHLWRLGIGDFAPDLLGKMPFSTFEQYNHRHDSLQTRYRRAWRESWKIFNKGVANISKHVLR